MLTRAVPALALSFAGGVAQAQAQGSVTVYGVLDTGITYANHVASASGSSALLRHGDGVAQGNRLGLRGTETLADKLDVVFTLEEGFSTGDGTLGQGGAEFGRQAWAGLERHGVGSVTLGRQYSLSRDILHDYAMGHLTSAGNYAYHINDLDQLNLSRINNAVRFTSDDFGGFLFGALYGFSNEAGAFAGVPAPGSSRTISFGAKYAAGPFSIGTAFTDIRFPGSALPAFPSAVANIELGTLSRLRTVGVGTSYNTGSARLWGLWTHTQLTPVAARSATLNDVEIGGRYRFDTALSAGIGYTFSKLSGLYGGKWHQVNSVVDYTLSKRTDVYLLAVYQKASGSNEIDGHEVPVQAQIGSSTSFIGTSGAGASSQAALRIGLLHRF
ncbi:porin [Caballeronia sp. LZ035]|uniref:porin n=1 Tax=Caballeronia sp. LZ035 TaxID=3038568 RepID=UPI0028608652|nr:porin [Caballeronia sp. LZ035]MDR5760774.1 porin [Caballeronia sp. LZ035]